MHNIVSESHRVARTYVGIFDWLVSYAVCELSFDRPNMTNSSGRMVKPESGTGTGTGVEIKFKMVSSVIIILRNFQHSDRDTKDIFTTRKSLRLVI